MSDPLRSPDSILLPDRFVKVVKSRLPGLIADIVGDPIKAQPPPGKETRTIGPEAIVQVNSRTYSVHAFLEHMATSSRTPVEVLEKMISHPLPHVRAAVAENKKTTEEMLAVLAKDEDPTVRYQLAENPHLPVAVLQVLSGDDNPYVACRAQRTIERIGGL